METGHGGAVQRVGRGSRLVQRVLLTTARPPLLGTWRLAYRGAARLAGHALTVRAAPGATVYARGSTASGAIVPGLSDIDLVLVVPDDAPAAPAAVHRRWEALRRRAPAVTHLVDRPRVHTASELRRVTGRSPYTFGLATTGGRDEAAGAVAGTDLLDRNRALERPGSGDPTGWRRVAGPSRALPTAPRDAQGARIAAWLELVYLWKRAYGALVDAAAPHTAALCVKLVTSPAATHAALTGDPVPGTPDALLRYAAQLVPEQAEAIARVRRVAARLRTLPEPPLVDAVEALVGLTALLADALEQALATTARVEVELRGATTAGLPALPLCDWQALVRPGEATSGFVADRTRLDANSLLRAVRASSRNTLHAVVDGPLVAFASATRAPVALRAVACAAVDPVSTALLAGAGRARFVEVDGWSASHWARRAVAEHRQALSTTPGPSISDALAAARAELLRLTLVEGAPVLPTTLPATLALLEERGAIGGRAAASARDALEAGDERRAASEELTRAVGLLTTQP